MRIGLHSILLAVIMLGSGAPLILTSFLSFIFPSYYHLSETQT